jgi:hypothetical protein
MARGWSGKLLTPSQISRIDAALEKGIFDILAGDHVTYVSPTGKQYPKLLCVLYNLKLQRIHGVIVDDSGLRDQVVMEMLFSKKRLAAAGVAIDLAGYWIIDGKRYDFAKGEEVRTKINAVGGLHNLLVVRVRESSEINQTEKGSVWGFDL